MPKSKEQNVLSRKRPSNSGTINSKNVPPKKKKSLVKTYHENSITKSKQLIQKLKVTSSKSSGARKPRSRPVTDETRICGNGKLMPPLAELEAMFDDSDDDSNAQPIPTQNIELTSPKTMQKITSKLMDIVTNLPNHINLIEQDPAPPIISSKKRKKPDVPYVVGCKDRPKIPYRPSVNFCKGHDYRIENYDDGGPKKRAKRTKAVNISKSIFNAKSDEIATHLKDCENDSDDSNKTVEYDFPNSSWPRSFSPLPSTSKDSSIILQNEKRFNDSLMQEKISDDHVNDVEAIEIPCETIILDDEPDVKKKTKPNIISEEIILDDSDDYLEIVEPINTYTTKCENVGTTSSINIDYYNSDFNQSCEEITEVINVDDVIAENQAIIKRFSQVESLNSVTNVDIAELNSSIINNDTVIINESVISNNKMANTTKKEQSLQLNDNEQNASNVSITNRYKNYKAIYKIVTDFFSGKATDNVNNTNSIIKLTGLDHLLIKFNDWLKTFNFNKIIDKSKTETNISSSSGYESNDIITIDDNTLPTPNTNEILNLPNQYTNEHTIINLDNIVSNDIVTSSVQDFRRLRKNKKLKNKSQSLSTILPNHTQLPPFMRSQTNAPPKGIGDCPICMDSLANNSVASTLCGHVFCMECIKAAIKTSGKKCPTCRKVLKGVGYHQLFL
ncbi:uncharacterized protein LOC113522628 [Galleria mellonella]|uniref:Uncharacterized protein LOC113522628 n=1 Tax=Galleria mellonella TaxID=7137 RepID=A0A6J1X3Q7_GALME|nr:uncharacterized protein LOC113522628 [Galleria mellonella]